MSLLKSLPMILGQCRKLKGDWQKRNEWSKKDGKIIFKCGKFFCFGMREEKISLSSL